MTGGDVFHVVQSSTDPCSDGRASALLPALDKRGALCYHENLIKKPLSV